MANVKWNKPEWLLELTTPANLTLKTMNFWKMPESIYSQIDCSLNNNNNGNRYMKSLSMITEVFFQWRTFIAGWFFLLLSCHPHRHRHRHHSSSSSGSEFDFFHQKESQTWNFLSSAAQFNQILSSRRKRQYGSWHDDHLYPTIPHQYYHINTDYFNFHTMRRQKSVSYTIPLIITYFKLTLSAIFFC